MKEILKQKIEYQIYRIIRDTSISLDRQAKMIFKILNVDTKDLEKVCFSRIFPTPKDEKEIKNMIIWFYKTPELDIFTGFDKYIDTLVFYTIDKITTEYLIFNCR